MWIAFIAVLASFCLRNIINSFKDFLAFNIITEQKMIERIPMEFPAVHFCFIYNDLREFEFQLENHLIYCYFNSKYCSLSDFESLENPDYLPSKSQHCFSFGGYKYSNKTGVYGGLQLGILLPNYLSMLYLVGSPSYKFFPLEIMLSLSGGMNSENFVEKTEVKKLGKPYNDCIKDLDIEESHESELFKRIVRSKFAYRQINCYEICFQDYVRSSNVTRKNVLKIGLEYAGFDFMNKCDCPLECDSIVYDVTSNNRPYYDGTNTMYDYVNGRASLINISKEEVNSNILVFSLSYKKLSYKKRTELPKTSVNDLISNLGGTLGNVLHILILL